MQDTHAEPHSTTDTARPVARPFFGWFSYLWLLASVALGALAFAVLSEAGQGRVYAKLAPVNTLLCEYLGCAHLYTDTGVASSTALNAVTENGVLSLSGELDNVSNTQSGWLHIDLANGDQLQRQVLATELATLKLSVPPADVVAVQFRPAQNSVATKTVSR